MQIKIDHKLITITSGDFHIWFSYEQPIAFKWGDDLCIIENIWGNTTGRHLNEINPDKSIRISREEFLTRMDMIYIIASKIPLTEIWVRKAPATGLISLN